MANKKNLKAKMNAVLIRNYLEREVIGDGPLIRVFGCLLE
jgi:hypothetical protein